MMMAWLIVNAYNPATGDLYIFRFVFAATQRMVELFLLILPIHFLKTILYLPIPGHSGCEQRVSFYQHHQAFV